MKLYFDFFNDKKETKYICLNETNNYLNINLDKFHLTVHLDSGLNIDYNEITDFFLIIEKNINGVYVLEKKISGTYDSGILEYRDCNFDDTVSNTAAYRLHFQFNEGGIISYNGKDSPYYINLKSKAEDFEMQIYDSIMIDEYYELQNINIDMPTITFKVSILNNKNFTNYGYYYKFSNNSSNENITPKYETLNKNELVITEGIDADYFKDDVMYLHFYLKDFFDNVSYKVFKITTKQNTLTLFEILNTEININKGEEFSIFYNSRNIDSVTPVVVIYDEQNIKQTYISEKTIGTYDKDKNVFDFKFSDYFEENFNNIDIQLYFILNNNKNNISNEMMVHVDSLAPVITISNFDDNNYKLITSDDNITDVIGKIQDNNFFYLGNNRQKIELENAKHYLILHSERNDIQSILFENESSKLELLKYSKYYIAETKNSKFEVYDSENNIVPETDYTYLNDFKNENCKNIYIMFKKKDLTQYELNIIENSGGLKVKGSEFLSVVKKQEFRNFTDDICYIKLEIDENIKETFSFDVGIEDFGYSFLPKINYSNISSDLTNKKEISTEFDYFNVVIIKSNADLEITKFTDSVIKYKKKTITSGELTFCPISLKERTEFFSPDGEFMYFDDNLNSFEYEEIYSKPKILDKNKNEIECLNYKVSAIDDGIYSFSFNVKIEEGINLNTLEYSDIVGNKTQIEFTIEKNINPIKIEIDELYNKTFEKFEVSENNYELTTNKKTINVKFIIKNETLNNINSDSYLIIKSDSVYKKQKILKEVDQRVVYVEFSNLTEEKQEFKAYYNNDIKENTSFSIINNKSIFLSAISDFVTGFNNYYLKYETDNFATIKLQSNNKNFICEFKDNNIIEITRINNIKFLEKIEIELIATDKHNLYVPVSKKIKGIFYNSSIIQDYSITNSNLYNNKIIDSKFDLVLNSYDSDSIEYIKYYDSLETDIFKRNKYAIYNQESQNYLIKDIITPLLPSYLDISIKIKDEDLIVNKRLYEEEPISLYEENNNIIVTYIKESERFHIRITNKEDREINYKKLQVYCNGNFLQEYTNVEFTSKNNIKDYYLSLEMFDGVSEITIKLINNFDKISVIYTELLNFDNVVNSDCYLEGFDSYNILRISDLKNIVLVSEITNGTYYLDIKEIINTRERVYITTGNNEIQLKEGQYLFELYYKNNNYIKKMASYNVEIIPDDFEYIDYSLEYSKYLKINTIFITKEINTHFKYLDAQILHYCNDDLIGVYEPDIYDSYIEFEINKQIGINRYFYKDKYHKFELAPYIKTIEFETQEFKIFAINTENKSLFYSDTNNSITLDSLENLYFKTENVDEMVIKTNRVRTPISKTLIDGVENVLFKEFIPCSLEFYKLGVLYNITEVKLQKDEKIEFPFFSTDKQQLADRYEFKIRNNGNKNIKTISPMYIKHRPKHFLYSYTKNIAILCNNKTFLSSSIESQEKKIKELCIEFFKKYKNNDIDRLKEFIKNKLKDGGNN